ncbi:unnamed protein product [Toxocara canis]|nr:unnamed protein product [Toxocara canis]
MMSGLRTTQSAQRRASPKFVSTMRTTNGDTTKFSIALKPHAGGYTAKGQHRLSVPDLAELAHSKKGNGASKGVASSAKALTSKLGRSPATGELQAINEGLVTPVVRRKEYLREIPVIVTSTAQATSSDTVKRTFAYERNTNDETINSVGQNDRVGTAIINERDSAKSFIFHLLFMLQLVKYCMFLAAGLNDKLWRQILEFSDFRICFYGERQPE